MQKNYIENPHTEKYVGASVTLKRLEFYKTEIDTLHSLIDKSGIKQFNFCYGIILDNIILELKATGNFVFMSLYTKTQDDHHSIQKILRTKKMGYSLNQEPLNQARIDLIRSSNFISTCFAPFLETPTTLPLENVTSEADDDIAADTAYTTFEDIESTLSSIYSLSHLIDFSTNKDTLAISKKLRNYIDESLDNLNKLLKEKLLDGRADVKDMPDRTKSELTLLALSTLFPHLNEPD